MCVYALCVCALCVCAQCVVHCMCACTVFCIRSPVRACTGVLLCEMKHKTPRLLTNYGFAIRDNPDDLLPLSFSVLLAPASQRFGGLQRQLLAAAGIDELPHTISFHLRPSSTTAAGT